MATSRAPDELIGRERALLELDALLAEARARDEVAVVRIVGPPGIGKTAFLRTAISRYARGATASLTAMPSEAVDQGACVRRLAASLGGASRTVADASAVCVDDFQWVDEVSVRTIGDLVHAGDNLELVLLADRREDATGLIAHRTIHLDSLDDDSAAALVRLHLPTASDQAVDTIVRAAAGLPFNLAILADHVASEDAQPSHGAARSVRSAIAERLARAQPKARDALRLSSLIDGAADLHAIAYACATDVGEAAALLSSFRDLVAVEDAAVSFRHALLREAVAATVEEPVGMHQRLLVAYLALENTLDRSFALLRCAIACGDARTAADHALSLGRQAAGAGASATALRYLEIAIRYAPRPLPPEYAVEYATVLQHLPRSPQAASFLRAELRDAIDRGDGDRAADLATAFSSVTLTLERETEFQAVCDRISAIPGLSARAVRRLRTARLVSSAFSGRFDDYRRLAESSEPSPADHRVAAFVAALEGEPAAARASFETYQAGLRSSQMLQEPADIVLQAFLALHEHGNSAIADLADVPAAADGTDGYQGVAHLRIAARINDGRWDAARELVEHQPLWDSTYEEPFPMLDARLQLDALSRRAPLDAQRTMRSLRAMIARGQVCHAVSPARWFLVAVERSGAPSDDQVTSFVAETLAVAPIPYLVTASPLALAFLRGRFGEAACLRALDRWPRFGSRWRRANDALAEAMLSADRPALREARDEFERLGAPTLAMIAGLELPAPRAADIARARALGYFLDTAPPRMPLTARETDVAQLVAQDFANREIAVRLGISERTVEVHLTNVFRKLGVRSRSGLTQFVLTQNHPVERPDRSPRERPSSA